MGGLTRAEDTRVGAKAVDGAQAMAWTWGWLPVVDSLDDFWVLVRRPVSLFGSCWIFRWTRFGRAQILA